ncbi:MAG TPA: O-antigen ligase family protein [Conexibacter sp.]|nr:O-antigen ligase family protein [Conexibacter sp.]
MTRRLTSHAPLELIVALGAMLLSALLVTLLAHDVKLGVAALGALIFVPLAIANTPLALCGWLLTAFLSGYAAVGSMSNKALYFIAAVAVMLFIHRGAQREGSRQLTRMVGLVVVFFAWLVLSLLWAPHAAYAKDTVVHLALAAIVFFLVLALFTGREEVRWLMLAFVAGAVLSVLSGAVTGGLSVSDAAATTASSVQGRLQGGTSDPNYLAAAIVPAMILAGGLAARRGHPLERFGLMVATIVLAIGLAATESRGGFLAVIVVAVGALLTWRGRRMMLLGYIAVFAIGVGAWFVASPSAWHRVTSASDGGSGRSEIWHVATRVVDAHPIVGVGLAQFPVVSPDYITRPGALTRADLLVGKQIVVHNAYLQLWVETGILGLALYLTIAIAAIAAAARAVRRFEAQGDLETATLARALLLAIVGALTASFFLSNIDDVRHWVLLALGPVLFGIAQRGEPSSASAAAIR